MAELITRAASRRTRLARALGLAPAASMDQIEAAAFAQRATQDIASRELVRVALDRRLIFRSELPWAEGYASENPAGFRTFLRGRQPHPFVTATAELAHVVYQRQQTTGEPFTVALTNVTRQSPVLAAASEAERRTAPPAPTGAALAAEELMRKVAEAMAADPKLTYAQALNKVNRENRDLASRAVVERAARREAR
jgi:hypothetical protein